MTSIRDASTTTLFWFKRTMFRPDFYITSEEKGGHELGALSFAREDGAATGLATLEGGPWTFVHRATGHGPKIVSIKGQNGIDLGVYETNVTKGGGASKVGHVILPTGSRYGWQSMSKWKRERTLTTEKGDPVLTLRPCGPLEKAESRVELDTSSHDIPELPLLVMLTYFVWAELNNRDVKRN